MPETKNKKIEDFQQNVKDLGIDFEVDDNKIIIRADIVNYKIITDLIMTALVVYFTFSQNNKEEYTLPLIILYGILIYVFVWEDFKSINTITIDLLQKSIHFKSRNLFTRIISTYILKKKSAYFLKDVKTFEISDNGAFRMSDLRHFVNMRLKNSESVKLISFSKKITSTTFCQLLKDLIHQG